MAIIKMHPFRKWLIEALGGTVMTGTRWPRVTLGSAQSYLRSDDPEANGKMRFDAVEAALKNIVDELYGHDLMQVREERDGLFNVVRVSVTVAKGE